jgi:hypothetical protein
MTNRFDTFIGILQEVQTKIFEYKFLFRRRDEGLSSMVTQLRLKDKNKH